MRNILIAIILMFTLGGVANASSSDKQQKPPALGPAGPSDVYYHEGEIGSPAINNRLFTSFIKDVKYSFGGYARFTYAHNPTAATVPAAESATAGEEDAVESLAELHTTVSYKKTAFHAGVFLSATNLTGNQHQPNNESYAQNVTSVNNVGGERLSLDYAYLSTVLPFKINLDVGRVPESFGGYCFSDCDSRRDRVMLSKDVQGYLIFAALDKRNSGATDPYGLPVADINSGSDAFIGLIHHMAGQNYNLSYGFLYAHFQGNTATESYVLNNNNHTYNYDPGTRHSNFALSGTNVIYDYIEGNVHGYDMMVAHNYLGGGNGSIFNNGSNAYTIRLGHSLPDRLHIDLEWTQALAGGFIHPGFDTMSSVINNNPDMDQSPVRLIHLGGLGAIPGTPNEERFNQWLIMSKISYQPTNAWTLSAGVGRMRRNGGYQTGYSLDPAAVFQGVANDLVFDTQAHYQLNKLVGFSATWGRVNGINHPRDYTGSLDSYAVSAAVGIKF